MNLFRSYCLLLAPALTTLAACATGLPAVDENLAQADTIQINSAKMNRQITTVVIMPEQYFDPDLQEEQFPVIYLLHGATGSYRDWPTRANLDDMATDYGVIVVCPDGQDSWYFDSPVDPKMQFETFISKELVDYIDSHYRTFTDRHFRAITGLSMGGHGALWNAFRHPDVFGACGSMSGGVDISQFPDRWKIDKRLGTFAGNEQRWREHTVVSLVPTLKNKKMHIIIDDGVDDFFYKVNLELHDALLKNKIDHDFTIRPGNHSWTYWLNSLDYHFLFFSKAFAEE